MTILPKKKHNESKKPDNNSNNDNRGRIRGLQSRPSPPERTNLTRASDEYTNENFDSKPGDPSCSTKRRHRGSPHRHKYHERHNEETGYNSSDEHEGQNLEVTTEEVLMFVTRIFLVNTKSLIYNSVLSLCGLKRERQFEQALKEKKGFIIKRMAEDGACLFRAVGRFACVIVGKALKHFTHFRY